MFVRYRHKIILFIAFSFISTDKDELLIPLHQARFTSDYFSLLNIESYDRDALKIFVEKENMDLRSLFAVRGTFSSFIL